MERECEIKKKKPRREERPREQRKDKKELEMM